MRRQFLFIFALAVALLGTSLQSAHAFNGRGGGRSCGRGFGGGIGGVVGIGGGGGCGWDISELYRQLYNNLPFYALHPPVYYSYPVPRTYGYSPFAYPPGVMTPDIVGDVVPLTISNPYVPATKTAAPPATATNSDRSAETRTTPEPLVIINPFVTQRGTVATSN